MCSFEERKIVVELFIKYDKSATDVINQLGYPNRKTLWKWYQSYLNGENQEAIYRNSAGYSPKQQGVTVEYYLEHGKSLYTFCTAAQSFKSFKSFTSFSSFLYSLHTGRIIFVFQRWVNLQC
jgi:DNA-directed RNA polymerase specialized sigma24 family protein